MSERKSKNKFKNFCIENSLRYEIDDCGNPISPSRVRKFSPCDHLWWTGGSDEKIGVSVCRPTPATYSKVKKKLLALGCEVVQDGECEGNFFASEKAALGAAKLLRTTKRKFSEARAQRMRDFWAEKKQETA